MIAHWLLLTILIRINKTIYDGNDKEGIFINERNQMI